MKIEYKYRNSIAILFFIFFTTPILSPAINESTIYINWFIPLLDFNFIKYTINLKYEKKSICILLILLTLLVLTGKLTVLIKLIFLIETILYMFYCKRNGMFSFLYLGININIVIGIVQFILYYINPVLSQLIGPTNISQTLWGPYATETLTNFYAIFKLVRISGWSREAGFFASLLTIAFIFYLTEKKHRVYQYVFFAIGYIISFSKVSFILIFIIFLILIEKYLNKIPYYIAVIRNSGCFNRSIKLFRKQ